MVSKIDEKQLLHDGYMVIGVDEVGRGALAGPIVACACAIHITFIDNMDESIIIRDSKKMTRNQREKSAQWLRENVATYALARVEPRHIDVHGIQKANKSALERSVQLLLEKTHTQPIQEAKKVVLTDHFNIAPIGGYLCYAITHGEEHSIAIAAASIIAKVYRDTFMQQLAEKHPDYSWDTNVGYGTAAHKTAIKEHGLTQYHRRSFIDS